MKTLHDVLAGLGSLLVIAQTIVAMMPQSKYKSELELLEQDSNFKKIFSFLISFAPAQKGANGFELSSKNVDK